MKKYFIVLITSLFLFACKEKKSVFELTHAKGNRFYGGTLRYNEEEYFKSLYPLNITEVTAHRIVEQIYDGLVDFDDSTLAVVPCLAEKWDINPTATIYTFYLRKGIFFHDDECFANGKGREVKAQDFKYCFDRLCFHNPADNQGQWTVKDLIKGATEYDSITEKNPAYAEGVSGVKVIDDYTLQIELYKPNSLIMPRLALPFAKVYPKEAVEKYGMEMRNHCVGTGPFQIKKMVDNQVVFLERNRKYWKKDEFGNQLPLLDNIKVTFIKEKKNELVEFKKGNHDLVYKFPLDMIEEVVDAKHQLKPAYQKFQLQFMPSMSLQYYGFKHTGNIFKDKRIRQAFCYAIDRQKLCDFTLKGTGFPAIYGYVPPGTGTYNPANVKGYTYQPEKARALLAEAGFPKGKGFKKVTLQLNSGGSRNTQVAEAITKMLKETLGIEVELLIVPWAQHTEAVEASKCDFYRLGWIADYPDAENFLNLFHGKNVPKNPEEKTSINSFRYKNSVYDNLLNTALAEVDETKRNILYNKADQQAIDDAVVLPNYYDIDFRILSPQTRNMPQNAMEYRKFVEVYFVPIKGITEIKK